MGRRIPRRPGSCLFAPLERSGCRRRRCGRGARSETTVDDIQLVRIPVVMDLIDSCAGKVGYRGGRARVFHQRPGVPVRAYQDRQRGGCPCRNGVPKVKEETAHIVSPVEGVVGQFYRDVLRADRDVRARYGVEVVTSLELLISFIKSYYRKAKATLCLNSKKGCISELKQIIINRHRQYWTKSILA